jgi:nucleoside-specific outer membrane channel protein Tsx
VNVSWRVIKQRRERVQRTVCVVVAVSAGWLGTADAQTTAAPPQGFSSWNMQLAYGTHFSEPLSPQDVAKGIVTFENAAAWGWGSSYFFVDILFSDGADQHATEVYAEWYPSASLSKLSGTHLSAGPLRDVSATLGLAAGSKSTGAAPLVFLPGVTFDFDFPGFRFLALGAYAYVDQGRLSGASNGCHETTYQVTPSWSLPFAIGAVKLSFDGFADFIGSHGACASQILTQPQIKLDVGSFCGTPHKISVGVEWQYWDNKFGIDGLDESLPQLLAQWVF